MQLQCEEEEELVREKLKLGLYPIILCWFLLTTTPPSFFLPNSTTVVHLAQSQHFTTTTTTTTTTPSTRTASSVLASPSLLTMWSCELPVDTIHLPMAEGEVQPNAPSLLSLSLTLHCLRNITLPQKTGLITPQKTLGQEINSRALLIYTFGTYIQFLWIFI